MPTTFAELFAAHQTDPATVELSTLTDLAHVASVVTEGIAAFQTATDPADKLAIGPFVQTLASHSDGLKTKAAAAAALDADIAKLHTAFTAPPAPVTPPAAPEGVVAAAVTPPTPGTLTGAPAGAPVVVGAGAPTAKVASFRALAGQEAVQMGTELTDDVLGRLWADAAAGVQINGQVKVASLVYIDERADFLSNENSKGRNTEILKRGTAELATRNAKTAAANASAGFAGPADYNRTIPFVSLSDRPILAAMRRVPIKGEMKHYRSAGLTTTAGGATIWDESDQVLVDPDTASTWKPVTVLAADNAEVTVTPWFVWGACEWDNFQEISAPERVDEMKKSLGVNIARTAEIMILDTLVALGGTYGTAAAPLTVQLGAFKGFLEIVETIMVDYGYRNRQMDTGWRTILPFGFERLLSIDKRNGQYGESGLGKSDIDAELRKIGLGAAVYALDDPTISQTRPLVAPFIGGSSVLSSATVDTDATVTIASTATLQAGMLVAGTGITAGTKIASITDATHYELSAAATATGTVNLTYTNANTQFKPLGLRKFPITMFDPASVFAGQRGVMTAAVENDATLNRQNRRRFRVEDMEAVGRDGVNAPITMWVQLVPDGTSSLDITYTKTQADFSTV